MAQTTDDGKLPFRITKTGIVVTVRLTPGASADKISGVEAGADGALFLKARVRAVPEKGKANTALIALMAKWLGVPKSGIEVLSGTTSRLKQLAIAGNPSDIADALKQALTPAGKGEG